MNAQEIIKKLVENNGNICDDHWPSHLKEHHKKCDGYVIITREGEDYVCPIFDLNSPEHSWNTQGYSLNPLYLRDNGEVYLKRGGLGMYYVGSGFHSVFQFKDVRWFNKPAAV